MKFVAPDACLEDYTARRSAFIKQVNDERLATKERSDKLRTWITANSPYSPSEKLQNLMKAIFEEE